MRHTLNLPEPKLHYRLSESTDLYVVQGDIVDLPVDILVSPDDTRLSMGGGASRRIFERGGSQVLQRTSLRSGVTLEVAGSAGLGEVFESEPGRLDVRAVFHTAVVDWEKDLLPTTETIRAVTYECICRARERSHNAHGPLAHESIAFPLMGSGAGGLAEPDSLAGILGAAVDASAVPEPVSIVVCLPPWRPPPDKWRITLEALLTTMRGTGLSEALGDDVAVSPAPKASDEITDAERLVRWLPAPVAVPMFSALQGVGGWERFSNALQTAEALVRFLACCSVATDLPDRRGERINAGAMILGRGPTLGVWVGILRENIRKLRHFDPALVDPLVDWNGKRPALGRYLFEQLPPIRNKYVHGSTPPDDAFLDLLPTVLEPLSQLAHSFASLTSYRLVAPVRFDWGEGDIVRYVFRTLQGPFAVFPTSIGEATQRLYTKHVYLGNPGKELESSPWLELDPLVLFAVCPTCQRDDVFFYDQSSGEGLEYRSFVSGHTKLVKSTTTAF